MNLDEMWYLVIPIIGAGALFFFNQKIMPWWAGLAAIVPGALFVALVFALSIGSQVGDTEILSGKITAKNRVHGTYEQAYECRCRMVSSGSGKNRTSTRQCDTCYQTHYTVNWNCDSTIGGFKIDARDSTWPTVYATPDPERYTRVVVGEPASRQHSYVNYIQAVPESLFKTKDSLAKQFAGKLPPYPIDLYDLWHINRTVTVGVALPDLQQWNDDISMMLTRLGPSKQVNVIVAIVKNDDPNYAEALRQHWDGVNKNDVVLVIGVDDDGKKIVWNKVLSWTKNETFKIELQDRVTDFGTLDRVAIMGILDTQITKNFERRHMAEFEYLKGQIDPPSWLLWTMSILLVAGYVGAHFLIQRNFRYRY